jgi:tetrathionate reductase subunit B
MRGFVNPAFGGAQTMAENSNSPMSRRDLLKGAGVTLAGAAVATVPAGRALAAAAEPAAPRWAMIMDLRKCTGCRACTVACKAEFNTPLGRFRAVVQQAEYGTFPETNKAFLPLMCNHCEGNEQDQVPPCVKVCPEFPVSRQDYVAPDGAVIAYDYGATYKRPDGMILVDNSLCIGCEMCIQACPYGVRSVHPHVKAGKEPEKNGVEKCSGCEHRVAQGVAPSCVNTCQGHARIFGDLNDPDSEVAKLAQQWNLLDNRDETTLLPEQGTIPHVFYIDPDNVLAAVYQGREGLSLEHFRDTFV